MPEAHVVDPWALEQAMPQAPQLAVLVCRFASQPLLGLPSQEA